MTETQTAVETFRAGLSQKSSGAWTYKVPKSNPPVKKDGTHFQYPQVSSNEEALQAMEVESSACNDEGKPAKGSEGWSPMNLVNKRYELMYTSAALARETASYRQAATRTPEENQKVAIAAMVALGMSESDARGHLGLEPVAA